MGSNGNGLATAHSTSELLSEFQQTGQQKLFEEIVRRYAAMVFSVCVSITKDPHDAEDATQATFLALAVQAKTAGGVRHIGPWLQQVAKRMSLDIRKSKHRRLNREKQHGVVADSVRRESESENPIDQEELRQILRSELDQLPAKYRLPLILCYFGGLSHIQIAHELGCRPNTLTVRLHRARQMLRDSLGRRGLSLEREMLTLAITTTVQWAVIKRIVGSTGRAAVKIAAGQEVGAPIAAHVMEFARVAAFNATLSRFKYAAVAMVLIVTAMAGAAEVVHRIVPFKDLQMELTKPVKEILSPIIDWPSVPMISSNQKTDSKKEHRETPSALPLVSPRGLLVDGASGIGLPLSSPATIWQPPRPEMLTANAMALNDLVRPVEAKRSHAIASDGSHASPAGSTQPKSPAAKTSASSTDHQIATTGNAATKSVGQSPSLGGGGAPASGSFTTEGLTTMTGKVPLPTNPGNQNPSPNQDTLAQADLSGLHFLSPTLDLNNSVTTGTGGGGVLNGNPGGGPIYVLSQGQNVSANLTGGIPPQSSTSKHSIVVDSAVNSGVADITGNVTLLRKPSGSTSPSGIVVGKTAKGLLKLGNQDTPGNISEAGSGESLAMTVGETATADGKVQGWGKIGLTGALENNGKVIADGYGKDRTLDLSSFSETGSSIPNTSDDGWYALNHGKLQFASQQATSEKLNYNFGENTNAGQLTLVNSAALHFEKITSAGKLSVSVISPDRDDVPKLDGQQIVGMWGIDVGTTTFDSATLSLRYDSSIVPTVANADPELRFWTFSNNSWQLSDEVFAYVSDTHVVENAYNRESMVALTMVYGMSQSGITLNFIAMPDLSFQPAAPPPVSPEPGSAVVMLVAGGAMLLRRRRSPHR